MRLPGRPDLREKPVLASDLLALTHAAPAQGGALPGDGVWEAAISGELIFHGSITSRKGFYGLRAKVKGEPGEDSLLSSVVFPDVGGGPPAKTADCQLCEGEIGQLPHEPSCRKIQCAAS